MARDKARLETSAGGVVMHAAGDEPRYLIIRDSYGNWGFPKGHLEDGERPEEAALREVREETCLEIEIVKPIKIFHLYRGDKTAQNELVGIIYWCTTQSDRITLSPEHDAYRWLPPYEALDMVDDPGIRGDIEAFIAEHGGEHHGRRP